MYPTWTAMVFLSLHVWLCLSNLNWIFFRKHLRKSSLRSRCRTLGISWLEITTIMATSPVKSRTANFQRDGKKCQYVPLVTSLKSAFRRLNYYNSCTNVTSKVFGKWYLLNRQIRSWYHYNLWCHKLDKKIILSIWNISSKKLFRFMEAPIIFLILIMV